MQAPRWVLIWRSQGKKKLAAACRPTRGLSFHLAYDRLVFNGLSVVYMGRVQSMKTPPMSWRLGAGNSPGLLRGSSAARGGHIWVSGCGALGGRCPLASGDWSDWRALGGNGERPRHWCANRAYRTPGGRSWGSGIGLIYLGARSLRRRAVGRWAVGSKQGFALRFT
jgi:hypothetical protein